MERNVIYIDYLFNPKEKLKEKLEAHIFNIRKILDKYDKTIKRAIINEINKANQFICLYNPEKEKISQKLYKVDIQKDNVILIYRITFISKNLNK